MDLKDTDETRKLFNKYQQIWSPQRVENMTLEQYMGLKGDGDRDDFCYWIESKLDTLGSIWGGSSFKFGIYKRDDNTQKEHEKGRMYSDDYAWWKKYGDKPTAAFEKIKSLILQVIEASENNDLAKIDKIDFGHSYKWKIAFHYQNPDDMKIFPIFREQTLKKIAEEKLGDKKLQTSQIYEKLMNDRIYTLEDSKKKEEQLWKQYGDKNDKDNDEYNQMQSNETMSNKNSHKNPPLNQILYGPPGTGKTYSTINKALEILCNEKFAPAISDRDEILKLLAKLKDNPSNKDARQRAKAKFDKFRQNGQIEFVTFHQSFSYEEFVEGIKPEIAQNSAQTSENVNSKELSYKIEAGIFKQICERALHKEYEILDKETNFQISDTTRVWKISIVAKSEKKLREKILEHCLNNNEIRIGWADYKTDEQVATLGANAQSSIEQFENASVGDMVCVFEGTKGIIRGVGIIDGEFYWDNDNADKDLQRYPRVRKVKWLDKNERDIYDLSGNLTLKTFYPLDRVKAVKLLDRMAKNTKLVVDNTQKPFILIIDEINRGNISKILGELITLIEPSKRIGATACVAAL